MSSRARAFQLWSLRSSSGSDGDGRPLSARDLERMSLQADSGLCESDENAGLQLVLLTSRPKFSLLLLLLRLRVRQLRVKALAVLVVTSITAHGTRRKRWSERAVGISFTPTTYVHERSTARAGSSWLQLLAFALQCLCTSCSQYHFVLLHRATSNSQHLRVLRDHLPLWVKKQLRLPDSALYQVRSSNLNSSFRFFVAGTCISPGPDRLRVMPVPLP